MDHCIYISWFNIASFYKFLTRLAHCIFPVFTLYIHLNVCCGQQMMQIWGQDLRLTLYRLFKIPPHHSAEFLHKLLCSIFRLNHSVYKGTDLVDQALRT